MKRWLCTAALLCLATPALGSSGWEPLRAQLLREMEITWVRDLALKKPERMAVLPFQATDSAPAEWGAWMTEEMTLQLFGQGPWKMLERARIEQLIREQGFTQTALADADTAISLGKLAGADTLVIGSYRAISATEARVWVRLVSVTTGQVLSIASGAVPLQASATPLLDSLRLPEQ
jgi:hypothetical protein